MRLRFQPRHLPQLILEGAWFSALIFGATALCTAWLYTQAVRAQADGLERELHRLARQAAALVDAERHGQLRTPEQMQTPLYDELLNPLVEFHRALPEVFYVYTVIREGNRCRFVLDTAQRSEALGFSRAAPSAVGDPYAEPSALLWRALVHGSVEATADLYRDEFGTFVSGFAPIFRADGSVEAVIGIDLEATAYAVRFTPLRRAAGASMVIGAVLALATGVGLARFRRTEQERERRIHLAEASRRETAALNEALGAQLRFLEVAAIVHHSLLAEQDLRVGLPRAFALLGQLTGADRIGFHELTLRTPPDQTEVRLQAEWCADPAAPPVPSGAWLSHTLDTRPAWREQLQAGQEVAATADDAAPGPTQLRLTHGLRSLVLFPITLQGDCTGVLVLEYHHTARLPSLEERAVLRSIASSIGMAATRHAVASEHEQNRRLLGSVLDSSMDAVVALSTTRDADGSVTDFSITLANPEAEILARAPAARLIGTSVSNVLADLRGPSLFPLLVGVVASGESIDREHQCGDSALWPWCRIVAAKLGDGLAVTISNITNRKVAEAELIRTKEGAEAADRAKTEFLAVISHEIRTPMNAVIGFTALLWESPLTQEQQEYVYTLRRSSETLLALINEILDFSKIEAGGIVLEQLPFKLVEAVVDSLQINRVLAASKGVTLAFEIEPDVPPVLVGDSARLQQVLINLIGNGVKFTDRGSVHVRVSATPPTDGSEQYRVRFDVRDSGIGIPSDKLHHLFKPFSQADSSTTRRYGGTGLGLAICKRLCQVMGGDITVASEAGVGSTFSFHVVLQRADAAPHARTPPDSPDVSTAPLVADTTATTAASPLAQPLAETHPLRILVAEDNPVNRRVVQLLLQRLGYRPEFAINGREAVRKWLNESPDLLLMDIQMPEMDGFAASREIRHLESFLPDRRRAYICALTAEAMRPDRQHCFDAGMNDYLSKPLMPRKLVEVLQRAADARREPCCLAGGPPLPPPVRGE